MKSGRTVGSQRLTEDLLEESLTICSRPHTTTAGSRPSGLQQRGLLITSPPREELGKLTGAVQEHSEADTKRGTTNSFESELTHLSLFTLLLHSVPLHATTRAVELMMVGSFITP